MNDKKFYRVHWANRPAFSAENAWSLPWGCEMQEPCTTCAGLKQDWMDTGEILCPHCEGQGECDCCGGGECLRCKGAGVIECLHCEGTGLEPASRGYSCCESAEALRDYFEQRLIPENCEAEVICFTGELQDYGLDGEALVVPETVLNKCKPSEFFEARRK